MTAGDLPAALMLAVMRSAGPEPMKVAAVVAVAVVVTAAGWMLWRLGRRPRPGQAAGWDCCAACGVMADDDTDDLMDPIVDIFAGEPVRPVNETRPTSVWSQLDTPDSNRGRHFDDRSRRQNERLVRWFTEKQQEQVARQAAPQVIAEAEALLRKRSFRERGETTGEIRRGDPGE
jgi:hypothetical protein